MANRRKHGVKGGADPRADARAETLRIVTWHTTKSGERVVRGPVGAMRVGIVHVRQWGRYMPVEIERLFGEHETKSEVTLVYGYPKGETAGQG